MLINQLFKIKVNKKNINWYQSKGYDCRLRDVIEVKTQDLIINTHIEIMYKCDSCGEIKKIPYSSFTKRHVNKNEHYCVLCVNKKPKIDNKYIAKDGFKICIKCNRKLPANTDYFFLKKDTQDGFVNKCKECVGKKFTDKLTRILRDGYKLCIKCDRELPIDIIYFPPDKMCKDGLRNVCRECGKDGHFMEKGYIPRRSWWNEEEENLLKEVYSLYTNSELIKLYFPNETNKSLHDKAWILGVTGKSQEVIERVNKEKSEKMSGENSPLFGKKKSKEAIIKQIITLKKYYSTHTPYWLGKKRSEKQRRLISERMKGRWVGEKNPKFGISLKGKDNPNWKGGITPLYFELRSEIKEWRQDSMKKCNYKCVITGKEFDNIHHLYSFRNIVNECFYMLNLDQRSQVKDYNEEDFYNIKNILTELHYKYGLGVCLKKEIHKLFHDNYGYFNNNPEQFKMFKERLYSGEFNDFLIDNNLKLLECKE